MHELSIALNIVEMAEQEARRRGGVHVSAVHLKIGPLAGVVKEALRFSYSVSCEGTMLEGSELVIEETPAMIYCDSCEVERSLSSLQAFFCPVCRTPTSKVIGGRELELVAMEME
ncbi:MAG TPA: hydrogenase maturation nickel metallochaperone HypA [Pyrinomonadaceae bacterium]|nr:hydrogenase maturation nickel metallochaperone HypA [Pyrinomonadaceae bacterium]